MLMDGITLLMSPDAEIYLRNDRTEVVGPLDVATDADTSAPSIHLDPEQGSMRVGGGTTGGNGSVRISNDLDREVVELETKPTTRSTAGKVTVSSRNGDPVVTLDASSSATSQVRVSDGDEVIADIEDRIAGGRLTLRNTLGSTAAVVAGAAGNTSAGSEGGRLTVHNELGDASCHLRGRDATLMLNDATGQPFSTAGGGEIVVAEERNGALDIHVHATGRPNSEFGVDQGNRPNIFLDGPRATLELGRGQTDSKGDPANGEIVVRNDHGQPTLELRATANGSSEAVFRWAPDETDIEFRGAIRAHPDGLMVYDAGNRPALLVTKTGDVMTRRRFLENQSLPV